MHANAEIPYIKPAKWNMNVIRTPSTIFMDAVIFSEVVTKIEGQTRLEICTYMYRPYKYWCVLHIEVIRKEQLSNVCSVWWASNYPNQLFCMKTIGSRLVL